MSLARSPAFACGLALLSLSAGALAATGARPQRLSHISYESGAGYTRIVLDLNAAVRYRSVWLRQPERLYLDLADVGLAGALRNGEIQIDDAIVKRVRTAVNGSGSARVVVDLNVPVLLSITQQSTPQSMILELRPRTLPLQTAAEPNLAKPFVSPSTVQEDAKPATITAPPELSVPSPSPAFGIQVPVMAQVNGVPGVKVPAASPLVGAKAAAIPPVESGRTIIVPESSRVLTIPRVARAPQIEDFLGGRAREAEARVSDFRQREPGDGKPASQATTAYLSYDDTNLYVVFVCRERPGAVRARMAKREDITENDRVGIYLDTFHDHQRAFLFASNALGVQRDSVVAEGHAADARFDTVWHSKGQLTADGFIVWMAIPFKSLRFPNTREQTWGIALSRSFIRNNETAFWPYITKREAGFARQMGELQGLEGISISRNIQIDPYVTATHERLLNDPNPSYSSRMQGRAGADLKAVIRNAFTLDATANPDFSQVESDDPQVTINQRFEVYFPEKRPFFIENAGYFATPINLFFSRRIADPMFGGRLTGKTGPWTAGVLFADDRAPGYGATPGTSLSGKHAEAGVARLQRDVGDQSNIGFLATDWSFGSSYNRLISADTRFKLTSNWFVTGQYAKSFDRKIGGRTKNGSASFAQIEHSGRHLSYSSSYTDRTPEFNSRLGFIPRVDIRQMDHYIGYFWLPEEKKVISFGPSVSYSAIWDHSGKLTDWYATGDFAIDFSNSSGLHLTRSESYEFLDVRAYRSHRNAISFYTNASKHILLYGRFSRGTATNYNPAAGLDFFTGSAADASFGFSLQASSRLHFEEFYFFDHLATLPGMRRSDPSIGNTVFASHTMRTKVNYQFTRALSARAIVDYYGVLPNTSLFNEDRYKRVATDFLLTYMLTPGTAFYAGYNEGRENLQLIPNGSPLLYRNGPPGLLTGRQVFVKLNYLFRF